MEITIYNDEQMRTVNIVKEYIPVIDTNAIIDAEETEFWKNMVPILRFCQKKMVIPAVCAAELEKIAYDQKRECMLNARTAIRRINWLLHNGLAVLKGSDEERRCAFADPVILEQILKCGRTEKILVITNDTKLAEDILNLKCLRSVKGFCHRVLNISSNGWLSDAVYCRARAALEQERCNYINDIHERYEVCVQI
ncbi:PIN domain-containing protein [Eubacterium ramulus]